MLIHEGLLLPLLDFYFWPGPFLRLEEILEYQPLLSWAVSDGILPSRSLERLKVCSPEVQGCGPAFCPGPSSQEPELHQLTVTAAKAAPELHIPNQFSLVYE